MNRRHVMKTTKIFGIVCGIFAAGLLAGCAGFSGSGKKENPVQASLSDAVRRGDLKAVKSCLDHGADITKSDRSGRTALHLAVMTGNTEIARYLLEHGANVNSRDNDGKTPLHIAFALKKDWIASLLIEHGADRKIQDVYGRTPADMKKASIEKNTDFCVLVDGNAGQPAGNMTKYPKTKRNMRKSKR